MPRDASLELAERLFLLTSSARSAVEQEHWLELDGCLEARQAVLDEFCRTPLSPNAKRFLESHREVDKDLVGLLKGRQQVVVDDLIKQFQSRRGKRAYGAQPPPGNFERVG